MANTCINKVYCPKALKGYLVACNRDTNFKEEVDFNILKRMPDDIENDNVTMFVIYPLKMKEWMQENWGATNNAFQTSITSLDNDRICIEFITAWGPPAGIIEAFFQIGKDQVEWFYEVVEYEVKSVYRYIDGKIEERPVTDDDYGSVELNLENLYENPFLYFSLPEKYQTDKNRIDEVLMGAVNCDFSDEELERLFSNKTLMNGIMNNPSLLEEAIAWFGEEYFDLSDSYKLGVSKKKDTVNKPKESTNRDSIFDMSTFIKNYQINTVLNKGYGYESLPLEDRKRKDLALSYIEHSSYPSLKNIPMPLKRDKDIVYAILKKAPINYKDLPKELKQDRDIVRYLLSCDDNASLYVEEKSIDDDDFLMELITKKNYIYKAASDRLRGDRTFINKLVAINPLSFSIATDELKNDKEYVTELYDKYKISPISFGSNLLNDKEFIKNYIADNPNVYNRLSQELKNDSEIISCYLESENWMPSNLSKELKDNEAVALKMATQKPYFYKEISSRLKNDKEFNLKLLAKNKKVYQYFNAKIKSNKAIKDLYQKL